MNNSSNFCNNPSTESVTEEQWTLLENQVVYGKTTAAFVAVYFIIGLPWNSFVTVTILWKKLYTQPTILLLLNLVLSDLLMLLYQLPVIGLTGFLNHYSMGGTDSIRCQVCRTGFIPIALMMNSLLTIALMSVDRFLFISKPFLYEQQASKKRTLIALTATLLVVFSICFMLGLLSLIPPGKMHFQPILLHCTIDFNSDWYMILLILTASVGLTIITICNVKVAHTAFITIRIVYSSKSTGTDENGTEVDKSVKKKRHKKQQHLFHVFGGLIVSNIIAWLPLVIVVLISLITDAAEIPPAVFTVTHILFLSQVAVHPILETLLICDVRNPMKNLLTCARLKKRKNYRKNEEESSTNYCCNGCMFFSDYSSQTRSTNTASNA